MARARRTGEWVLRVYAWSAPTISLGRNQTAMRHYDLERIRRRALAVVRRPTGGRAILHHREITYSVTATSRRRRATSASRTLASTGCSFTRSGTSASTRRIAPKRRAGSPAGRHAVLRAPRRGRADVRGAQDRRKRAVAIRRRPPPAWLDPRRRRPDAAGRFQLVRADRVAAAGDPPRRAGASSVARGGGGRVRDRRSGARRPSSRAAGNRRGVACPSLGSRRPVFGRFVDVAAMMDDRRRAAPAD